MQQLLRPDHAPQMFMLDCTWLDLKDAKHVFFTDVQCLAMPHLLHAAVAVVSILAFGFTVLALVSGTIQHQQSCRMLPV